MRRSALATVGLMLCALSGCVTATRTEFPSTSGAQASPQAKSPHVTPAQFGGKVVEVTGVVKSGYSFVVATNGLKAAVISMHDSVPPVSVQMEAVKEVTGCQPLPNPAGTILTSAPDQKNQRLSSAGYDLLCPRSARS